MAKVLLESWRYGLEKISLTKLQIDMLGMSLKEAKSNVDSLLDDNIVSIEIDNEQLAKVFQEEVQKIGVNCRFVAD